MTQTAVEVPARAGQEVQITIAATPISTRERNIAFGVIVVIAVLDAIVAPFAHVQLPRVDAFIPAVQSVMCVIDLLTAVLLLAQYSIQPMRGVLAVASGYGFSGLFAFIQTLTYPGAYSPTGLIGDINSAPWIFVFWHTAFPLALKCMRCQKTKVRKLICPADRSGSALSAPSHSCLRQPPR